MAHADEARSSEWYLSPSLSYLIADDDRTADNDFGLRVGVGKILNSRWNIEFSGVADNLDFENGSGQYQQRGIVLDGLYMFNRDTNLQPFALLGFGALRTKAVGESNVNPLLNIGLGFMHPLTNSDISIRGDIRHRWDFDNNIINSEDEFNDWLVSFGVVIPFGGSSRQVVETETTLPSEEIASDSDNDGVWDNVDKCPNTAENAQVDAVGCEMDSDKDGVVNSKDQCPGSVAGVSVDDTGCEFDADTDKDGVQNRLDKCPDSLINATVDAKGCERDSDNDGVADSKDKCANTPAGMIVDAEGCVLDGDNDGVSDNNDNCPSTAANVNVDIRGCELQKNFVLKGVNFVTGSDELTPEAMAVLDDMAATLTKNAGLKVEIVGYTDNTGNVSFNQSLSQRRAESVKRYLELAGVPSEGLTAKGYGVSDPIADNATREGRAINRRVEMHIVE
ncbi:MAG: OmpA family protein [Gammaproteobacteria bacterium]|nr:OmpA family protein [Gammaproteobacteria bacterium]